MRIPGLVLLFALPPYVHAAEPALTRQQEVQRSASFLAAHPDLKHRRVGLLAWENGDAALAFRQFRRAAHYADKPSQAMIAEMLWQGSGVEPDHAQAYAWMDLAAERGQRHFVLERERYWQQLDAEQRERALALGAEIYARFGDAAAKPRLERQLQKAKYERTGSNVGFLGPLSIKLNVDGKPVKVYGETYYRPEYWEPGRYWAWTEAEFEARGSVEVGALTR
jgi:hypothetical protein